MGKNEKPSATRNSTEEEEMVIKEPHDNDIVCGRGGKGNNHPGNQRLRMLIQDKKEEYLSLATKYEKTLFAMGINRDWKKENAPGRFLKKDETTGTWKILSSEDARKKTSQLLREGAPRLRSRFKQKLREMIMFATKTDAGTAGTAASFVQNAASSMMMVQQQQQQQQQFPLHSFSHQQALAPILSLSTNAARGVDSNHMAPIQQVSVTLQNAVVFPSNSNAAQGRMPCSTIVSNNGMMSASNTCTTNASAVAPSNRIRQNPTKPDDASSPAHEGFATMMNKRVGGDATPASKSREQDMKETLSKMSEAVQKFLSLEAKLKALCSSNKPLSQQHQDAGQVKRQKQGQHSSDHQFSFPPPDDNYSRAMYNSHQNDHEELYEEGGGIPELIPTVAELEPCNNAMSLAAVEENSEHSPHWGNDEQDTSEFEDDGWEISDFVRTMPNSRIASVDNSNDLNEAQQLLGRPGIIVRDSSIGLIAFVRGGDPQLVVEPIANITATTCHSFESQSELWEAEAPRHDDEMKQQAKKKRHPDDGSTGC